MKNKALILLYSFLLLSLSVKAAEESKYAFLTTHSGITAIQDDDEEAAAQWFAARYPTGEIVTTAAIKNKQANLSQYKVVWIHIDRENQTGALPAELTDTDVRSALTDYYKNGGNLFLSIHATQYIADLGRISVNRKPNIIGAGNANFNQDPWAVNPNIGLSYDYSSHTIYAGTAFDYQLYPHPSVPLIGSGQKEDHNCMWDFAQFGYAGNPVDGFESENNATVLGTWGHTDEFNVGGIIEFHADSQYKGRCLAIGLGAYEWSQNEGTNLFQNNILQLTEGVFTHLTLDPPVVIPPVEGECKLIAHFPMELNSMKMSIKDLVANTSFTVDNAKPVRENVKGAEGNALRFDGFSTFVNAAVNTNNLSNKTISASLWCALESYPMMDIDGNNSEQTYLAGNMKDGTGFAFTINAFGKYGFEVFIDGRKVDCYANEILPKYEWALLTAIVSIEEKSISLYRNNQQVGKVSVNGTNINTGGKNFIIGRSFADHFQGPNRLNTINGLIDDIRVYSGKYGMASGNITPENPANLSIPVSRFEYDIQRPHFHSMPGANWGNETHGLVYYNNKYHLFYQKNGAGPYWGRIHWGHLVSDDLISWQEVKTALDPLSSYDMKGNWSGCIFTDDQLTNGKPRIYYTSVDLARASIAEANPLDDNLLNWAKAGNNPVVPHRPDGLSDDFRDPYVFKANGKYYMVVGTGKDGRGAVTLHHYNPDNQTWSNDGRIFYQATGEQYGKFWEMPVVVPMADNKWLFVATPLHGKDGVEVLYWVGSINADGTFNPLSHTPKEVELGDMSKDGFGMLSPSVMQHNGKTIVIGIVPDKVPEHVSHDLGWAHTFSLPREWTLDANNNLVQKPYEGLKATREGAAAYTRTGFNLNGAQSLNPVAGRKAEMEATFTVSGEQSQNFGFNVRKNGDRGIKISYRPAENKLSVDARAVDRIVNDDWIYNGLYESRLPATFSAGQTVKLHLFIDHSIMDIFINDTWAFSIRIFPTDVNGNGIEVFSEGGSTLIQSLNAWNLSELANPTGISSSPGEETENTTSVYFDGDRLCIERSETNAQIRVYNTLGSLVAQGTSRADGQTDIVLPLRQAYIICGITDGGVWKQKVFKD